MTLHSNSTQRPPAPPPRKNKLNLSNTDVKPFTIPVIPSPTKRTYSCPKIMEADSDLDSPRVSFTGRYLSPQSSRVESLNNGETSPTFSPARLGSSPPYCQVTSMLESLFQDREKINEKLAQTATISQPIQVPSSVTSFYAPKTSLESSPTRTTTAYRTKSAGPKSPPMVSRSNELLRTTSKILWKTRDRVQSRTNLRTHKIDNESTTIFCGEAMEKGLLLQLAIFHLQSKFTEFPASMMEILLRREKSLSAVQEILLSRGWEMTKLPSPKQSCEFPHYFYSRWSYDCWLAFDDSPCGSYISCIKDGQYFLVYKDHTGKILNEPLDESTGPLVSKSICRKYSLTNPISRPMKRLICEECNTNTPCKSLTSSHRNIAVDYPVELLRTIDESNAS